ncbi:hypothetical protein RTBOTA2_006965 [Rhodotorula toruloides]|nr:hypothetical protein RTBOTA2_006965 [Rhodotorula toruloides]
MKLVRLCNDSYPAIKGARGACRMTTPLSVWPDDTAIAATQSFGPFGPAWGGLRVPTILPLFPSLVATDAAVADWDTATEEDCEGQTDPLANARRAWKQRNGRSSILDSVTRQAKGNPQSSASTLPPVSRLQPMSYTLPSPTARRLSSPQSIGTSGLSKLASSLEPNLPIQVVAPHSSLEPNLSIHLVAPHSSLEPNRPIRLAAPPSWRRNHISLPIIRFTVPYQTLWPILYDYIYTSSTVAVLADLLKHQVPPSPFSAEPPEVQQYQMSALVAKLERIRRLWHNAAALGVEDEALWLVMARAWGVWLAELMEELEEPV